MKGRFLTFPGSHQLHDYGEFGLRLRRWPLLLFHLLPDPHQLHFVGRSAGGDRGGPGRRHDCLLRCPGRLAGRRKHRRGSAIHQHQRLRCPASARFPVHRRWYPRRRRRDFGLAPAVAPLVSERFEVGHGSIRGQRQWGLATETLTRIPPSFARTSSIAHTQHCRSVLDNRHRPPLDIGNTRGDAADPLRQAAHG